MSTPNAVDYQNKEMLEMALSYLKSIHGILSSTSLDYKETKAYQDAMQARDWQMCDLIAEEHQELVEQVIIATARAEHFKEALSKIYNFSSAGEGTYEVLYNINTIASTALLKETP